MICFRVSFGYLVLIAIVFSFIAPIATDEDDWKCLRGVKKSLGDPQGELSSWTFTNTSSGSVCNYTGVSCWDNHESRLFGLELRNMKLAGKIPEALQYCHSLQSVDLSGNQLTKNEFLSFLLSGAIPDQFSSLVRIKKFSVANNDLSGVIPSFLDSFDSTDFVGNNGLCGRPLGKCGGFSSKDLTIIIVAGVSGAVVSLSLSFGLWYSCFRKGSKS